MILVQRGIMTIPEDERFVGFAGDNLCLSRTFLVEDAPSSADIYKLFLTFDNSACNYFELVSTVSQNAVTLLWNIREEHILKPGVVKAQLKAYSSSGEIWHSSVDWFVVDESAEFSDYFSNKENSEFLSYERKLLSLKKEIEETLAKLPYQGEDGYWYIYSEKSGSYIRMADISRVMGLAEIVDLSKLSEVAEGQLFRCQGSVALKTGAGASDYVELSRWSATCPVTRKIAGLPLTADISAEALREALSIV